ncbi:MAG TPA: alpha-amylase family glycosyl hydrolase [Candidatus Limnocylindrales bacterium]|nr:alpha-amylase family glycosyl hydrolase [Candidatus Limnocylindrales bacterium]
MALESFPESTLPSPTPDAAATSVRRPPPVAGAAFGEDWWQRGVVYQVYPRSFADSTGDGVGDLPGLIEHLDHLNDGTSRSLGVDAIWLSPIYPSPGLDVGYDVSDHAAIDPLFGTLDDFDRLIAEAHRRGIRVILDLVMNHTSSAHPWFGESRSNRSGPRADWYIWRDPPPGFRGRRPRPNNWVSFFGGPAWTWDPVRGQFYLHTFLPEQPDLNWRNPEVREAMLGIVRGWLERGVDGFRLDVFNAFFKHPELRSNPRRVLGRRAYDRQRHSYDKDQPEMHDFLTEFRSVVDAGGGRMTVGELFATEARRAGSYAADRHLVFDFHLIEQSWRADSFAAATAEREAIFGRDRWPTVVLSNHDQSRHASRLSGGRRDDAVVKAAAVLLLTLRGTPFLYYGEEIGLRDVPIPRAEIVDPPARRGGAISRRISPWWNRDQARAPMPWGEGANGGFSPHRPWLRMAPDASIRNVAAQSVDPASALSLYRRLIWLRREHPALQTGGYRQIAASKDVFGYLRLGREETLLVAVNFADAAGWVRLDGHPRAGGWSPLVGTHAPIGPGRGAGERVALRPNEAIVFAAT